MVALPVGELVPVRTGRTRTSSTQSKRYLPPPLGAPPPPDGLPPPLPDPLDAVAVAVLPPLAAVGRTPWLPAYIFWTDKPIGVAAISTTVGSCTTTWNCIGWLAVCTAKYVWIAWVR